MSGRHQVRLQDTFPQAETTKGTIVIPTTYHYLKAWAMARLPEDQRGAGLVEYILLVSMVIIVVLGAVALFRARIYQGYTDNANTIAEAS